MAFFIARVPGGLTRAQAIDILPAGKLKAQVKRAPATAEMPVLEIPQPPSSVLVVEPATETATHPAALDPTTPALPRLPPPLPRSGRHNSADLALASVPVDAPQGAWDLTRLSDPLVSILSRPGWLAVLGGVALLSFVVVNVLVWASLKPKPPGPTVPQPRLDSIDDVIVGRRAICFGTFNHRTQLVATRVDVRTK